MSSALEAKYRAALRRICARRGRFSRDPLQHADNVILEGVNTARVALGYDEVANLDDAELDLWPELEDES